MIITILLLCEALLQSWIADIRQLPNAGQTDLGASNARCQRNNQEHSINWNCLAGFMSHLEGVLFRTFRSISDLLMSDEIGPIWSDIRHVGLQYFRYRIVKAWWFSISDFQRLEISDIGFSRPGDFRYRIFEGSRFPMSDCRCLEISDIGFSRPRDFATSDCQGRQIFDVGCPKFRGSTCRILVLLDHQTRYRPISSEDNPFYMVWKSGRFFHRLRRSTRRISRASGLSIAKGRPTASGWGAK